MTKNPKNGLKTGTMEQKIDDFSTVTDMTCEGKCSECGECCTRYLALNTYEINRIKKYIERNNIQQNKHIVNVMAERCFDMVCPFMDDNKPNHKCSIYEVRPLICRDFICRQDYEPTPQLYRDNRRKVDMVETFYPQNKTKGD